MTGLTVPEVTANKILADTFANKADTLSIPVESLIGNVLSNRENLIINADFNVWQRGTSFAAIAAAAVSADRFKYNKSGTMVHTVSRSTDVPTLAESGHLSNYSILVDCTTADASIAAGDYSAITYAVEGYDFTKIAQKEFTLSFWVKGTKTGIHCIAFRNAGSDRCYIAEYTIDTTDTWEKKSITVSASPSAGTWDYINGKGLDIWFMLATGTTFHTTPDAWNTGNFLATANQVNATDSASNDFRIAQVQLEVDDTATVFNPSGSIAEILAKCQRYYAESTGPALWQGDATSGGTYAETVWFPQVMRVTPTLVGTHVSHTRFAAIAPTFADHTADHVRALMVATSTGTSGHWQFDWTADAEL